MERIAPLAKILAEANGIDWRHLDGSGESGMIVEQDILNYLSRVMSGEEEPPSTPVDAPPPEWTGTELPAGAGLLAPGMPSMDMLSSAGVDSDLAALVGQPQAQVAQAAPASLDDDLEFELEEDEDPLAAAPAEMPTAFQPAPVQPVAVQADLAAPVAEVAPAPRPAPEVVPPAPRLEESTPLPSVAASVGRPDVVPAARPEPVAAQAPAAGGVMAGLGSLLSRLYQQPAAQPAPAPTPAPAEPVQPAPMPAASMPVAPVPAVPETPLTAQAPEVVAPEVLAPELPAAELPATEVHDVTEVTEEELALLVPAATPEPAPAPSQTPEQMPAPQMPAPAAEAVEEPEAPAPAPLPLVAGERPREAVWFGTYLRRDANLAPATELRRQLAAALGQEVPLALLVARAAQRYADSLGLDTVAVQDLAANRARTVQPGSLRDALSALATDHEGTSGLLVTDAGALDLDDLHLPHTVTLSVGRVQDGCAALSLNGDVDAAQAARFLANVAGTLEEPIILVI
ncbi:E3 binding domain-containing protein [Deinococcus phoenicis]|nr:E3 binding domain-containing protein [Deinococcus phoenicis]